MLDVERWAELRREHFVRGVGIKELARRYGVDRNTVRRALRSEAPPRYQRAPAASKLDPFKDEICELLRQNPSLSGVRVRELVEPLGFGGGKTIVDDYVREIRPLFERRRTFQRTVYRPGEVCQFDLWHTTNEVPVGHGQSRQGYVVVAALGYSRVGAGALIFSRQANDVLWGMDRCLGSLDLLSRHVEHLGVAGERPPPRGKRGWSGVRQRIDRRTLRTPRGASIGSRRPEPSGSTPLPRFDRVRRGTINGCH